MTHLLHSNPRTVTRIKSSQYRGMHRAITKKPNKFKAKPTLVEGHRFDSKLEAKRYGELKLLERAGKITALQLQPKYPIAIGEMHICVYIADFSFFENERAVAEDVKSKPTQTAVYRLKAKLFKAMYPEILHREIF